MGGIGGFLEAEALARSTTCAGEGSSHHWGGLKGPLRVRAGEDLCTADAVRLKAH